MALIIDPDTIVVNTASPRKVNSLGPVLSSEIDEELINSNDPILFNVDTD